MMHILDFIHASRSLVISVEPRWLQCPGPYFDWTRSTRSCFQPIFSRYIIAITMAYIFDCNFAHFRIVKILPAALTIFSQKKQQNETKRTFIYFSRRILHSTCFDSDENSDCWTKESQRFWSIIYHSLERTTRFYIRTSKRDATLFWWQGDGFSLQLT